MLQLKTVEQDGVATVYCRGRIVFGEEADDLRLQVLSLLKRTNRIVLHMSGVQTIDSGGLGTLVGIFISVRHRHGTVKIAAPSRKAREVLGITHLDSLIDIYTTADEAAASFPRKRIATAS